MVGNYNFLLEYFNSKKNNFQFYTNLAVNQRSETEICAFSKILIKSE